jgi:carboxyl-terminal processing protease
MAFALWCMLGSLWLPCLSAGTPDADIQVGLDLERERRWSEAVKHYEESLRRHREAPSLEQRLQIARVHYDVDRRYRDRSFQATLDELSAGQALDLYTEVLANIESHYVDTPNWAQLQRHGTAFLEVALLDENFRQRHLRGVDPELIEAFRLDVHHHAERRVPQSRQDLRVTASLIADLAADRLQLPRTATILEYVCGAIGLLDPYTRFLTGDQLDDTFSNIEGNFVGLGVEIKAQQDALEIVSVIGGGPAAEIGIRGGDRILAVDKTRVADVEPDYAADLLRGPEGSPVLIELLTAAGEPRELSVVRRRVDVPSIENAHIIDVDHGVAYCRLTSFQRSTCDDMDRALWQMHRKGMQTLILDLRGNPGGLLPAAVEVADRFLNQGRIVSTRGRNTRENFDYVAHRPGTWNVPLLVLVDDHSASASEIFAGAIRDHERGILFGSQTYGKGSVQGIFQLHTLHAGLCLTTAKFYSPKGQAISQRGVQPHHAVATDAEHTVLRPDPGRLDQVPTDPVVAAALQYAREQIRISERSAP